MIYSDRNLSQKFELTEALSNKAFVEARVRVQPESNATWIKVAGAYAMFDGVDSPLTQTFGLGVFELPTRDDFEYIETFFRGRGAQVFHEISPMADLSILSLLAGRGYQPVELTNILYRPIAEHFDSTKNSNIKIRIINPGEETIWAQTSARGWSTESPGLSEFMFAFGQIISRSALPFLAELNEKPVATGVMFIHKEVALLAGACTIPEARRQGAQAALFKARLNYAVENGCTIAMIGALPGSQSQRNAEKQGFHIAYTRIKWQLKD